jgi:uncharacterized protein Yka (UPF0111/DUF47 family)
MGLSFFSKSPKFLEMIIDQNNLILKASDVLLELFTDFTNVGNKCALINAIENNGNEVSNIMTKELSKALVTSIDREDILAVNSLQEELLNAIKAISSRVSLYKSDGIPKAAIDLVEYLKEMSIETSNMLKRIELKKSPEQHYQNLMNIKGKSELLMLVALGELYEQDIKDPRQTIKIMIWAQIYDRIESAQNYTQELANAIERVSVKNA